MLKVGAECLEIALKFLLAHNRGVEVTFVDVRLLLESSEACTQRIQPVLAVGSFCMLLYEQNNVQKYMCEQRTKLEKLETQHTADGKGASAAAQGGGRGYRKLKRLPKRT